MTIPDWYVTGGVLAFLWMAGPALILCLVVGIAGAVFQTATQIREAAITFVPKALGLMLLFAIGGGFMVHQVGTYTKEIFSNLSGIIHGHPN